MNHPELQYLVDPPHERLDTNYNSWLFTRRIMREDPDR